MKSNKTLNKTQKEKQPLQPEPGVRQLEEKDLQATTGATAGTTCRACFCTGAA